MGDKRSRKVLLPPDDLPPLDVRIPADYVDWMMHGDITGSMMLTMVMLHRWADWETGTVEYVSAQGLSTASDDAYHRQTFKDALVRWEDLGHIQRHLTLGSHKSYPVTLFNLRRSRNVVERKSGESVLKHFIINPRKTVSPREFRMGLRPEPIPEWLPEGVPEALPEGLPEGIPRTSNIQAGEQAGNPAGPQAIDKQESREGEAKPSAAQRPSEPTTETKEPEPPYITEVDGLPTEAYILSRWLAWMLAVPFKSVPSSWDQEFNTMLLSLPKDVSLLDLLVVLFSEDENENVLRWRDSIYHPKKSAVGYLKTILPDLVTFYQTIWLPAHPVPTLESSLQDLLEDEEPYVRDGRQYRFRENKLRPPCWYALFTDEERPGKPGWYPVDRRIAVGLDLPFPLDGTVGEAQGVVWLKSPEKATDNETEPCGSLAETGHWLAAIPVSEKDTTR